MRIGRSKAKVISELTIDGDLDMLTLYQVKRLHTPASGEALKKGYAGIVNADIHASAGIAISKLVDDYLPEVLLTAQGDIIVRGASLPERLAKITTGQILVATATGYEGTTKPIPRTIATGTYTGNAGDDRDIATGFKCSCAIVFAALGGRSGILIPNIALKLSTAAELTGGTTLHATDGFTVYQTTDEMNTDTVVYYYWAISE